MRILTKIKARNSVLGRDSYATVWWSKSKYGVVFTCPFDCSNYLLWCYYRQGHIHTLACSNIILVPLLDWTSTTVPVIDCWTGPKGAFFVGAVLSVQIINESGTLENLNPAPQIDWTSRPKAQPHEPKQPSVSKIWFWDFLNFDHQK